MDSKDENNPMPEKEDEEVDLSAFASALEKVKESSLDLTQQKKGDNSSSKTKGYVYILTNLSLPGVIKIGHTTRSIDSRVRELSNTSLPTEFEVLTLWKTSNSGEIEKLLHSEFSEYRINKNREFFREECTSDIKTLMKSIVGDESDNGLIASSVSMTKMSKKIQRNGVER